MIGGLVTIGNGGTLQGGSNGIGSLTLTNGLNLQTGSTTSLLIRSTNNYTSFSILGGTVKYGGTLRLDLSQSTASAGDRFSLFSTWGNGATNMNDFSSIVSIGKSFSFSDNNGIWTGAYGGLSYQFNIASGNLTVSTAAIPEPSTYALFGLGVLALVFAYSRKVA